MDYDVNSAENLVAVAFLSREIAHREHLKTSSFAAHMALGSFYDNIIPIIDSFVEKFQGQFQEKLEDIEYLSPDGKADIAKTLRSYMEHIEEVRYKAVDKKYTPLHNVLDELVGEYQTVLYKLTFLS